MIYCEGCALPINSDDDLACVEGDSKGRKVLCECCRELEVYEGIAFEERRVREACPGIEIEPGVFSGCDQSAGDCPTCGF